jgi:hypothetical protein
MTSIMPEFGPRELKEAIVYCLLTTSPASTREWTSSPASSWASHSAPVAFSTIRLGIVAESSPPIEIAPSGWLL